MEPQNIIVGYHGSEQFDDFREDLQFKTGKRWTTMLLRQGLSADKERRLVSQVINNMQSPRVCWLLNSLPPAGHYTLWPVRVPLKLIENILHDICLN